MLVVVFLTFGFYYSCDAGAVWSAGRCVATGWARSESVLPVLCSGFLWKGGCADSNYREVSSNSYFLPFFLRLFSVVLVAILLFFFFLFFLLIFNGAFCFERYLAAKNGTNCWVLYSIGFFFCRWFVIWMGAIFLRFLEISAIFIVYGWFSVLKILLISPLFFCEVCEVLRLCCSLELIWNFIYFDLVLCGFMLGSISWV